MDTALTTPLIWALALVAIAAVFFIAFGIPSRKDPA